jgi:hypothetical protein
LSNHWKNHPEEPDWQRKAKERKKINLVNCNDYMAEDILKVSFKVNM